MNTYKQFHGGIAPNEIGKELRKILKIEKNNFKILTGYGSTSGICISKDKVIKSLSKLKLEKAIKGFLDGGVINKTLLPNDLYYEDKMKYKEQIKKDKDVGNDGIIFVFIK